MSRSRRRPPAGRWALAPESYVEARVATHLMWRLSSRFNQVASPRGAAQTPRWVAAAAASGVVDVATARWLRRNRDFHLAARLALEALDTAVWCAAAGDDPDTTSDSVIPGVALASEAGARLGMKGLVVPLVNAGVLAAVRKAKGHDPRLWQIGWQIMGVLGGMGLSVSAARRRVAVEAEHDKEMEARLQGAELEGLQSLISTGESLADQLQRASLLVDLGAGGGERSNSVGAWKAALAESTRSRGAFAGDTFLLWQRIHNLHPDLSTSVGFHYDPDVALVLLSSDQASELNELLDSLDLRGTLPVSLVDPAEARRPEGRRDFRVGPHLVSVGRSAKTPSFLYDAVPTAFLMSALWYLPPLSDTREGVPWKATGGPFATVLAAAAWTAWRADRDGLAPRRPAIAASAAATAAYAWTAPRQSRFPWSPDGAARYPWTLVLQGYELVREHGAPSLDRGERWMARFFSVAIVATGWIRTRRPRSLRALAAELVWPIGIGIWARATSKAIDADARRLARDIRRRDDEAVERAFESGRRRALAYLHNELRLAVSELDLLEERLEQPIRDEARRRLTDVEQRLSVLGAVGA